MNNLPKMTDEDLFFLLGTTDHSDVFVEIYNRYYAQLYSAARKRCSSCEVAEEIVQDLFINLWNNRSAIKIKSSLSGYLFTAVKNLVLNQLQKEAVQKKFQLYLSASSTDYDNSTEEKVLINDLNDHINANLTTLPQRCRSIFELSRKQYKSNKQIAAELGITEKTVENQITRAIRFLRVSMHFFLFL